MNKQVEYFIKIYTNEGIEEIVHKAFKSWNDDLNEMIANDYYFDDFGVRFIDVEMHGPMQSFEISKLMEKDNEQ